MAMPTWCQDYWKLVLACFQRDASCMAIDPGRLPHDTLLRILRMTAWRPDWGRASGVSKDWHALIANDVCYKAIRQRWIEDHDEDLQSMFRHVYFFSCTCQVCAAVRTCFGMFISSAALVRYAALWPCFGMFISSAELVRYVLLFRHVLACLFLQLHLSGMCSSLDMFWHVYFVSRTCQACLLLTHVLARLFLLSNLPGMLCQPNMCVLFWTITGLDDTFAIVCLRIDDIIVYNALFATLTAQ